MILRAFRSRFGGDGRLICHGRTNRMRPFGIAARSYRHSQMPQITVRSISHGFSGVCCKLMTDSKFQKSRALRKTNHVTRFPNPS
jgi:hypothetical protein